MRCWTGQSRGTRRGGGLDVVLPVPGISIRSIGCHVPSRIVGEAGVRDAVLGVHRQAQNGGAALGRSDGSQVCVAIVPETLTPAILSRTRLALSRRDAVQIVVSKRLGARCVAVVGHRLDVAVVKIVEIEFANWTKSNNTLRRLCAIT